MSKYKINTVKPTSSHHLLVGIPLAFVLVLSFGFIIMHSSGSSTAQAKVSTKSGKDSSTNTENEPAQSAPAKVQPVQASEPNGGSSTYSGSSGSSSPDTNAGNSPASNPQSASQNHGSSGIGGVVNDVGKKLGL